MQLKWIKIVRAKGRRYYYFDTGRMVGGKKVYTRLPDPKSPDFGAIYAVLLGHRNRGVPSEAMRVPKLIDLFRRSAAYTADITASSRRVYDIYLRRFEKLMPTAPVADITRVDMRKLLDGMADTPGAANLFLAVCSAMFKWAVGREYVSTNPCDGIERLDVGEHEPWPEAVLKAALASPDDRVRLLTHLLYYTAQRLNDVLGMTWGDIAENELTVRQRKTGKVLTIPLHHALKAELAKTPRRGITICTLPSGRPITETPARDCLKKFVAGYGLDRVPHGLRKNAVISLLEAGCSVAETAAISGQSFKMVEHYAKQRDQPKLARGAVLQWERNGS